MNDATQETRQDSTDTTQLDACPVFPDWCEETLPGHLEHSGFPDMTPVSATAERNDFEAGYDHGILVPQVLVDISCDRTYDPAQAPDVGLTIRRPGKGELDVHLTVDEADYLRRHLVQVLRSLGREVPR